MSRILRLRWWILGLVFLAAVLNYIDRQTLSALSPAIQADLGMDDRAYANVLNLFLVAYTIAYLLSGKLVDRLGTRVSMAVFVAWWSIANMLTAGSQSVRSLGFTRFLLGLGEAGVWPAASKAVSEWFPPRERALAIGIYTMGATFGATLAPYFVIPLASHSVAAFSSWPAFGGWRLAFVVTGTMGLFWLIPWTWFYRVPPNTEFVGADEASPSDGDESEKGQPGSSPSGVWSYGRIFKSRLIWILLLGRLLTDPVWYFYQFWFPKYLHSVRGLEQQSLTVTWVIYAAAGLGSLVGGLSSGALIKRGVPAGQSRLWIMLGAAAAMPLSPLIVGASGTNAALTLASVTVFCSLAWLTNISSLVIDVVPRASLGTVFGVIAAGSTLGGMAMNTFVARLVAGPGNASGFLDRGMNAVLAPLLGRIEGAGYAPWFWAMAILHPLALVLLWTLRRDARERTRFNF